MSNKVMFIWLFLVLVGVSFIYGVAFYKTKDSKEETVVYKDFVRTYSLLYYKESANENYIFITLEQYQTNDVATVKIAKELMPSLEIDGVYEFHFSYEGDLFEDTIYNIFANMTLLNVIETDKLGIEETQSNLE